ncbi:hypothetical protein BH20ACT22_BH20ACT22_12770 [soil metagenome]
MHVGMNSLRIRLPLLAVGILAASLAVATLIAYELLLAAGHDDLDNALQREVLRFQQSIDSILRDTAQRESDIAEIEDPTVRRAVEKYIELNPSNQFYLIIVSIGDEVLTSEGGPKQLLKLRERDQLPLTTSEELRTVDTRAGEIRSLAAPVVFEDQEVATFQVAGPLEPIRKESLRSLLRLGAGALVSLVTGGALLAVALRRALVPLRNLASTARSTEFEDLSIRVPEPGRADEVGDLAREFNNMLERLQRTARDRRDFLAAISHELRTPITIARGHIETLESIGSRNPEALSETASVVREELHRMARLVEDLMALARSETEDFVIPEAVSLPKFFDELELRLTGLGVDRAALHAPPRVTIRADADRLAQAVLNLVVNAQLHAPKSTRIEVSARRNADAVVIAVSDDGPGIDQTIRESAFEPFVKGPTIGPHDSTGLGLAVVAAVVKAHGGVVKLDTGAGGTTVSLHIPMRSL